MQYAVCSCCWRYVTPQGAPNGKWTRIPRRGQMPPMGTPLWSDGHSFWAFTCHLWPCRTERYIQPQAEEDAWLAALYWREQAEDSEWTAAVEDCHATVPAAVPCDAVIWSLAEAEGLSAGVSREQAESAAVDAMVPVVGEQVMSSDYARNDADPADFNVEAVQDLSMSCEMQIKNLSTAGSASTRTSSANKISSLPAG